MGACAAVRPNSEEPLEVAAGRKHLAAQIAGRRSNRYSWSGNPGSVKGIHGERPKIVLARLQRPWLVQQFGKLDPATASQRIVRSRDDDQWIFKKHFH